MKKLSLLISSVVFLITSPNLFSADKPVPENHHAVEISIGSIGTGLDISVYRQLRRLIGTGVAYGILDKFIIYAYGIDGGFSGCVEDRPTKAKPSAAFEDFVAHLGRIYPQDGTVFSYQRIKTCLPLKAVLGQNASSVQTQQASPALGFAKAQPNLRTGVAAAYVVINCRNPDCGGAAHRIQTPVGCVYCP